MGGRYRLVTYSLLSPIPQSDPLIQIETDDLKDVEGKFSTKFTYVLYDTKTKKCIRTKRRKREEPIYLAKAVALARSGASEWSKMQEFQGILKKGSVETLKKIFGKAVSEFKAPPGVTEAIVAHIQGPLAAVQGKGLEATKVAASLWGSLAEGVVGMIAGGPSGAAIDATIGGSGAAEIAGAIMKSSSQCCFCKGEGIVYDYPCLECGGYGNVLEKPTN